MKLKILIRKGRRFILIVSILFIGLLAQSGVDQSRAFDEEAMQRYAQSDDFAYMNLAVRPPSIWQRLQWWLAGIISRIFMNPNTPWLSDIVFYALLFLVIGVAIFYILRLRYGEGFTRNTRNSMLGSVHSSVANSQLDYDQAINEAVTSKNYKLAIRFLYLKTLQFLSQKELIKLKDWKSPFDYNRELKPELVPIYGDLTKLFEYVWYGDFNAKAEDFEKGSKLLSQLQKKAA